MIAIGTGIELKVELYVGPFTNDEQDDHED